MLQKLATSAAGWRITNSQWNAEISETRDTEAFETRDMEVIIYG